MSKKLNPPVSARDHLQGNPDAAIELVEYGDYQCPHCGRAYPIIKQLQEQFGSDLKLIFRNLPLSEIHPDAVSAAVATEAAALQDKFWEMHDIIFENQDRLSPEDLFHYAKKIGLDLEQFRNDIQREELLAKVDEDFESGIRSGVNATPTFFVNGEKYNGNWESGVFGPYLEKLLEA